MLECEYCAGLLQKHSRSVGQWLNVANVFGIIHRSIEWLRYFYFPLRLMHKFDHTFVRQDSGFRLWDRRQSYVCASHRLRSPALSLSWEATSQVLIAVGASIWCVCLETDLNRSYMHILFHLSRLRYVRFTSCHYVRLFRFWLVCRRSALL